MLLGLTYIKNGATSVCSDTKSCEAHCTNATCSSLSCNVSANCINRDNWDVLGWNTNQNAISPTYTVDQSITLTADTTFYAITSQTCQAGKYSSGGALACQNCATGSMSATNTVYNTDIGSCTVCAAGKYNTVAGNGCHTCMYGYYCPGGNSVISCPGGTTSDAGAISVTGCYKQYTATFEKNGATSVGNPSITSPKSYCVSTTNCPKPTITTPTITRSNWVKLGWNTNQNATSETYTVGQSITLSANTTFYAITSQTCQAGYYSQGGASACQCCIKGRYKTGSSIVYNTDTNNCTEICSGKPDNSHYTNVCQTNNNCPWQCDDGFVKYKDGDGKEKCGCPAGEYYDSSTKKCEVCPKSDYGYTSDVGATAKEQCYVACSCGEVVTTAGGKCTSCLDEKGRPQGMAVPGHRVYLGSISSKSGYVCKACINLPSNAHYTGNYCDSTKCSWGCNADYTRDAEKNLCQKCLTNMGYHSPAGSSGYSACTVTCPAGQYVDDPETETFACVYCATGYASIQHTVSEGTILKSSLQGFCTGCTNGPDNRYDYPLNVGYHYTSYGTTINPTNCTWVCNAGFYKTSNKCLPCGDGYTSEEGLATSFEDCYKKCEFNGIEYNLGETITGYLHATELCPTRCQQVSFTCHSDGSRRYNGNIQGTPSNSCEQQSEDPSYKLSSCPPEANCSSKSIYIVHVTQGCTPIRHTRYRISSCQNSSMHVNSDGTYCCYGGVCTPKNLNGGYSCTTCAIPGYTYEGSGCYTNYSWACFVSGTKVTMADGTKKNIEDVNIGDKLLGQDGVNTVLELYKPLLKDQGLISINGGKNFVTPAHPFMTTEGWKSLNPEESMELIDENVTLLKVGDVLVTENGYEVVKSLVGMSASPSTQLYNFRVDGDNTYYANGYLVHNKEQHPAMCTTPQPSVPRTGFVIGR